MALTSGFFAEEVLSLPPGQRRMLARLLLERVADDGRSEEEICAMLRGRMDDLKSGREAGIRFQDVFGGKPPTVTLAG